MFKFIIDRLISEADRRFGGDSRYLRMLYAASPRACRDFMKIGQLAAHREAVPAEAHAAAMLVGVLHEDCGPCVQTVINIAREAGVSGAHIEAALTANTAEMTPETAIAFRFASAVVKRADAAEAREAVRARWGDKGVIDLTFALQFARIYPMIKTGLGFAAACQRVDVGGRLLRLCNTHEHER